MPIEFIGAFQIILGVLARFWPVWVSLIVVLGASYGYRKRLGLYGHLFDTASASPASPSACSGCSRRSSPRPSRRSTRWRRCRS